MMDTTSYFPDEIDDRVYFQDIDLEYYELKKEYDTLIANGQYSDAKSLYEASDFNIFGADILNLLENRLVTIGEFLPTIEKPNLTAYRNDPPDEIPRGYTWID